MKKSLLVLLGMGAALVWALKSSGQPSSGGAAPSPPQDNQVNAQNFSRTNTSAVWMSGVPLSYDYLNSQLYDHYTDPLTSNIIFYPRSGIGQMVKTDYAGRVVAVSA